MKRRITVNSNLKEIKFEKGHPPLVIGEIGGSGHNNFRDTYAVDFTGENYLYYWEIDKFIKGLEKAKKELAKLLEIKKGGERSWLKKLLLLLRKVML